MNKPKVLLIGPVCNISGYSEHARTLLDALIKVEENIDLYLQNTQWAAATIEFEYIDKYSRLLEKTHHLMHQRADDQGNVNLSGFFDISFQVRPPNEFQQISEFDVGVTAALETTSAPAEWVPQCNMMSHILVVSEHAKKNLKNTKDQNGVTITTPVTVIPFGYNPDIELTDFYKDLDVTTKFNFLSVLQMAPRKNFDVMMKWFLDEYADNEDVGIFIKTHTQNSSTLDFHQTQNRLNLLLNSIQPQRKCKVYLVHGNFSEEQMLSLYNPEYIDCYLTLTHGEGFGIPIFNAACAEIPIIATNWSGHLDYLRAPVFNKSGKPKLKSHFIKVAYDIEEVMEQHLMPGLITKECKWAYPKEDSFKKALRFIHNHKSEVLTDCKNLSKHLKDNYSLDDIHKRYTNFLDEVLSGITTKVTNDKSTFFL